MFGEWVSWMECLKKGSLDGVVERNGSDPVSIPCDLQAGFEEHESAG